MAHRPSPSARRECGSVPGAIAMAAVPRVRDRGGGIDPPPEWADRDPAGAARSAPPSATQPQGTTAVRDSPLEHLTGACVLPGCRGRP